MKKLFSVFVAAVTAASAGIISFAEKDSVNKMSKSYENETVICDEIIHGIEKYTDENGNVTEVGIAKYITLPEDFAAAANGCSAGNHLKPTVYQTPDVTRVHGYSHPGYCTIYRRSYYRCDNCHAQWEEVTTSPVWCPGANITDSVTERK